MSERLARLLMALCSALFCASLVAGIGWYRVRSRSIDISEIGLEDRQRLLDDLVFSSPATHVRTWYEPRIGYTLKRNQELTVWGDTFRSNSIGYRTGPVQKEKGIFRVVFVGDSWTYGQGIKESESFPQVFEQLASQTLGDDFGRDHLGDRKKIEAWTLALPGYNTFAETAALWFFFDRIRPDAIVLVPSSNDNYSMGTVLPSGSLTRSGVQRDSFGEDHMVTYGTQYLSSYRYLERWRQSFQDLRRTEQRLQRLGIPVMLFFLARWAPPFAHRLVQEAGLESPYMVVPVGFTLGEWLNPPPLDHGTPAANRFYGRMVYRGLARVLGGPELAYEAEEPEVMFHLGPPAGTDWSDGSKAFLLARTKLYVPESYRPSAEARPQVAGPMNPATGVMQRATTILVRRAKGATRLVVEVERVAVLKSLYPLGLEVSIPSPAGGTRVHTTVPSGGPPIHRFEIAIPEDLAVGTALDVTIRAERTASSHRALAPRSVVIRSIEQNS